MEYQKRSVNFRKGDLEALANRYKAMGVSSGMVIRHLVSKHVDAMNTDPSVIEELKEEIILE